MDMIKDSIDGLCGFEQIVDLVHKLYLILFWSLVILFVFILTTQITFPKEKEKLFYYSQ
ncbi:hypothetical protein HanIR_Chr15g0737491 [Helianthus annuus]|nr:hypothetical protein HanIR_Chr15g0737491 [Helianthus annuus]